MSKLAAQLPQSVQAATMRAVYRLPRPLKRLLAGRKVQLDGQTLALDAQLLLRLSEITEVSLADGTVEQARTALARNSALIVGPDLDVDTRDLEIPGKGGPIPARVYTPRGLPEPSPLLVFYHGGGWVIGDLDSHDYAARFLADRAQVRVLSVEYRLAPEHPFPAAVEDAITAYEYAATEADAFGVNPARIAVSGDSAGGNLAAVVAQQAVRDGVPAPALQVLIYPEADFSTHRASRSMFGEGFFLTDADMTWFEGHYLPDDADRTDLRMSPLLAADLTGLPPAYVVTAGFDPLRDSGAAYAQALNEAGVPVVYRCHSDLIHGFLNFIPLAPRFREAVQEIATAVRAGLTFR